MTAAIRPSPRSATGVLVACLAFATLPTGAPAADAGAPDGAEQPAKPAVAYASGFATAAGPEWSDRKMELTPTGKRRFLGRFGAQSVTLVLKNLPRHRHVRLSLKLFVIGGWDGRARAAPAVWGVKVQGGPELLRATFSNDGKDGLQTYPDDVGALSHRGGTGAAETNSLGFRARDGPGGDSVYRMRFGFAHAGGDLRLTFFADGLGRPQHTSWGLDDVRVELLASHPAEKLSAEEFGKLWGDLASMDDPVRARQAADRLAAAGEATVTFLEKKLVGNLEELKRLIAELDHADWRVREKAAARLDSLGPAVRPTLRRHLERTGSPEVRAQLKRILAAPGEVSTQAAALCCIRATNLLRRMGSSRAQALGEALAWKGYCASVLRFRGTIDGSDDIIVTNEGATWKHLSYKWPPAGDVELNGVKWRLDPKKPNVLANAGKTRFLLGHVDFSQATIKLNKGRGAVRVEGAPGKLIIHIDDGPQGGEDLYSFEVRFFP